MRISKYELITEIVMLCDELEAYKSQCETLKAQIEAASGQADAVDLLCLREGRRAIFEHCIKTYWNEVDAKYDDNGFLVVTEFEAWRSKSFDRCPDSMSKNEFFERFDGEFRALYEEKKAEAIARLEAEEADND